jgi:ribosomal protein S18 acetylase RimI-like enzyme
MTMPAGEVVLRDLRADDRSEIARILQTAGAFQDQEIAVGLELVDESLDPGPATDYAWWIAQIRGRVVGFACYGPVPLTVGTYDLYWIAVEPDSRGLGVAARLDEAVTTSVRGLGGRWLLAETSSTAPYAPAQAFYARRGYRLVGRIEDFYRPGDDRLTFGKRLDQG